MKRCVLPAALVLGALLIACGAEDRIPSANLPPTAELAGGPVEGSESSYAVRMEWSGHDPDGAIARFEYAIDPPAAFSEEEIASGGEGITSIVVPADGGAPAVTRVSKTVDGEVVSFDWVHTDQYSLRLRFSATTPDSALESGVLKPQPRYSGTHAFYVRAVDDREVVSAPDRVGFTATTVTPEAWITSYERQFNLNGPGYLLAVSWTGRDADRAAGEGVPAAFEYKLVPEAELPGSTGAGRTAQEIMTTLSPGIPWVRAENGATGAMIVVRPETAYYLGVRAVDEAGARSVFFVAQPPRWVEVQTPYNTISFLTPAAADPEPPVLTVHEPFLGTFDTVPDPPGIGSFLQEDPFPTIPTGFPLHFRWSATTSDPRITIEAFNFGVDLKSTTLDDPGWTGWTRQGGPAEPVVLHALGRHVLSFLVVDSYRSMQLLNLEVDVVRLDGSRELLLVDDSRDTTYPRDTEHDAFWSRILTASGRFDAEYLARPELWTFSSHGSYDVYYREPQIPGLDDLFRYRLLIYDCDGAGYDGFSGFIKAGPVRRHLSLYLAAGGQLWVSGRSTVAAMFPTSTGRADFTYPREISRGSFAWEFMKLYSGDIANDKSAHNDKHGMLAVDPTASSPFPAMVVDQQKLNPALRGKYGVSMVDVATDGIDPARDDDFRGVLEPLYVMRARYPYLELGDSAYDRKLAAIRWHDPDPDRAQGRIMWFGFPVYWFQDDQFQETFNRAIDWFREESPPANP